MENHLTRDVLLEESYKDLFDNAYHLIQLVDLEGRALYANKSWTQTLGYELQEVQAQFIYSFILMMVLNFWIL